MTDRRTVLVVVISMALIALAAIASSAWLIVDGRDATEILTLAGVAVGSLGSMLAHTASAPPTEIGTAMVLTRDQPAGQLAQAPHEGAQ